MQPLADGIFYAIFFETKKIIFKGKAQEEKSMERLNNLEFAAYYNRMIRAAAYDHKKQTLVAIYGGTEEEQGWDPQVGSIEEWFVDCERVTIPETSYEDFLRNGGTLIMEAVAGKLPRAEVERHLSIMMSNADYGTSWYGCMRDPAVRYPELIWISKNPLTIEQKLLFQDYNIDTCGPWIQNCIDAIDRESTALIAVDREFTAPDLLQQLTERTDKPVIVQNVNGDWVRVSSIKAEPYTL